MEGFIAPEGQDVGLLPVQIARIASVDLDLLGYVFAQTLELRPDRAQCREINAGMAEQLSRTAAHTILGNREARCLVLAGAGGKRSHKRSRFGQCRSLAGKGSRPLPADTAPGFPAPGQPLIGIVGSESACG